MAKSQINTRTRELILDKDTFLKELKQFNESKSIPYKIPVVNGVEIDLYLLYSLVQQRGGLNKVNQTDTWESFLRPLKLPYPCVNGSTLLRKIYGMYLEKYERAKGPPGRDDDNDMDEDPRRSRGHIPRVTFTGGTYISASGEQLKTHVPRFPGPSERLTLSLLSPMPNEQDFAVNVCTVLAADHSNRLPLSTSPHILDFMLAHAGVYNHSSLRDTIGRSIYEARGRYPHDFWQLRAGGGGAKELADETKFMQPGIEQPELMVQALVAQNTLTDCLVNGGEDEEDLEKIMNEVAETQQPEPEAGEDWVTEPSDEDVLFAPELPGGASCVYTQRVLQIASIVRSLSFHDENIQYLARNTTLVRFLLLCANCWVGALRQSGLDTLGNIATELIIKEPSTCLISRHVLSTIQTALSSPDRARILAALELLNKLSQNEANEDALLKSLESKVYSDVCSLLTLRDIMALVCSLECVYSLTSLGEAACEAVARVSGVLHTLVSLVTVEAQSYGPRACILMRVVETVSGPAAAADREADKEKAHQLTQQQLIQTKPETSQVTSATPNVVTTHAPAAVAVTTTAPVPPLSSIQQSHIHQRTVQENEHFVQAWLRSSYEPLPAADTSSCDAGDLYRAYVAVCSQLGRKGVVAPAHLPRLVRSIFGGTVGPNTVKSSTGETQQVYIGIKAKNQPPKSAPPAGPSSPILKAQLTNKVPEVKPVTPPQAQPSSHPHLSQALETNQSNTTLIKHLLAHKVSPAVQTQVAQRQQRVGTPGTVVVQTTTSSGMDVDPEALIKCTTITPGGIATTTEKIAMPAEEILVPKEEPVHIQIDEQAQLTIKSAQNKMLADLLEKKSNPPVQVVQMATPTIQITETGQIVTVKSDNPVLQINADNATSNSAPYYQIRNEQGQVIQIKSESGQIIQLKSDQLQGFVQYKNDQGHIVQTKNEQQVIQQPQSIQAQSTQAHNVQPFIVQPQNTQSQIQSVIQSTKKEREHRDTVAVDHSYTEPPNKKSKVEDKSENGSPQESVSKTAANLYAALAASALEDEDDLSSRGVIVSGGASKLPPPKQESMEVIQQPVMMPGADNAPVIIQEPILQVQQPAIQVQQSALVQGSTLQMQQPMLQVQPMDVQNIIASQAGQLILQEKTVVSQAQYVQQPMQIIAAPSNSQGLSYITQNIPGNMMQKTIIIVQGPTGGGPLTLTVNNPGGLDEATLNSVIAQATEALTQQQIIQNSGVIQSAQRVIVSQPTLVSTSQSIAVVKTALAQNAPQITPSQQPMITTQPQPHKAQIMNQPQTQQIVVTQKQPPALVSTSSTNQMVGNQHIIQSNQQLMQGNQQIIAVSSNQQIIMNSSLKSGVHRIVQQTQRNQVATVSTSSSMPTLVDSKTPHTTAKTQPPIIRQVIRQPVMVGNTKIGEKETIVSQTITEQKPSPRLPGTPPPLAPATPAQEETPWICHWKGCGKTFSNASGVFSHAARCHCPGAAGGEAPCLWTDCDRVPRKTFALLNHLNDKHCTPQALKAIFNSRRHVSTEPDASKPASVAYPPNAALAALNKHANETFNPRELMDENEGPVTKSIRLTAALILRNIVIYSNTGRRIMRQYEAHLAAIALSNVEASRTIAQVLYDMNNIGESTYASRPYD
ncbi:AT-rich interactive domain-containing protein 2 isoform X3 [Leptidea sinapis]|uniref:AT-rich interactive domain-containing protein 2 isoform X3 n=1 Tax=Leptidea sinapis TaxID=189913 RepID=UPI0021C2E198|nr:AT-rich interactive domain-containing protein 2 isoform X3 [Leptidea sinapis]